jgi:hypothetical protein
MLTVSPPLPLSPKAPDLIMVIRRTLRCDVILEDQPASIGLPGSVEPNFVRRVTGIDGRGAIWWIHHPSYESGRSG